MFLPFPLAFGEKNAWNLRALQHFVLKICTYLPWESCPIETAPLLKYEHNVNYKSIKCYMTLNYRINVIPLTFSSLSAFFSAVFPANVLHTVNKSYNVVFFFWILRNEGRHKQTFLCRLLYLFENPVLCKRQQDIKKSNTFSQVFHLNVFDIKIYYYMNNLNVFSLKKKTQHFSFLKGKCLWILCKHISLEKHLNIKIVADYFHPVH